MTVKRLFIPYPAGLNAAVLYKYCPNLVRSVDGIERVHAILIFLQIPGSAVGYSGCDGGVTKGVAAEANTAAKRGVPTSRQIRRPPTEMVCVMIPPQGINSVSPASMQDKTNATGHAAPFDKGNNAARRRTFINKVLSRRNCRSQVGSSRTGDSHVPVAMTLPGFTGLREYG
jgi:hypothetical protein